MLEAALCGSREGLPTDFGYAKQRIARSPFRPSILNERRSDAPIKWIPVALVLGVSEHVKRFCMCFRHTHVMPNVNGWWTSLTSEHL
jgi:hypothetical protein